MSKIIIVSALLSVLGSLSVNAVAVTTSALPSGVVAAVPSDDSSSSFSSGAVVAPTPGDDVSSSFASPTVVAPAPGGDVSSSAAIPSVTSAAATPAYPITSIVVSSAVPSAAYPIGSPFSCYCYFPSAPAITSTAVATPAFPSGVSPSAVTPTASIPVVAPTPDVPVQAPTPDVPVQAPTFDDGGSISYTVPAGAPVTVTSYANGIPTVIITSYIAVPTGTVPTVPVTISAN